MKHGWNTDRDGGRDRQHGKITKQIAAAKFDIHGILHYGSLKSVFHPCFIRG